MLKEYPHDTEVLKDEIRALLAEARQRNPIWFSEFVSAGEKINPRLLRVILPNQQVTRNPGRPRGPPGV